MNSESANQRAKYLTDLTKISHVVVKTNKEYFVFQKENWKGNVENTYNYEDIKQPEEKSKQEDIQAIHDVFDPASKKILQGNRNKGTKTPSHNG